jgi:hypothetical protein
MQLLPQVETAEARASDDEDLLAGAGSLHGHGHLGHMRVDMWVSLRRGKERETEGERWKGGAHCANVQQAGKQGSSPGTYFEW